jgi:hypothetical protein
MLKSLQRGIYLNRRGLANVLKDVVRDFCLALRRGAGHETLGGDREGVRHSWRGLIPSYLQLKLSVRDTSIPYLLETEGLFSQGLRPGRTFGESVGDFRTGQF